MKTKKKKKRSLSQNFYEIRCEFTKLTKKQFLLANSMAVNTNLGVLSLDLHSKRPSLLILRSTVLVWGGHNFCLGGHKQSFGGHGPGITPVAPDLVRIRPSTNQWLASNAVQWHCDKKLNIHFNNNVFALPPLFYSQRFCCNHCQLNFTIVP